MLTFITHRPFWVNLLAVIVLTLLLLLLLLGLMNSFTRHGDYIKVPYVKGKQVDQVIQELKAQGFEVEVQDSAYRDNMPKLAVVWQVPEAGEEVKIHRTIYLTVNRAVAPMIDMPNLLNLQFKFAESSLPGYGLKLGDTSYRPDFAKNTVLEQQINGTSVKAGTKVPMGSVVSLVLGAGVALTEVPVPDLFGMRLSDARVVLEANQLSIGSVVPDSDVSDTSAGFIYRQNPGVNSPDGLPNHIRAGQLLDVYLSRQLPVRVDSTNK